MKCNRYVGTGLAANVKPITRLSKASSDHISKNTCRHIRVTSKSVPASHFNAKKPSNMPSRKINQNESSTTSIEEKVINKSTSTIKMKYCLKQF